MSGRWQMALLGAGLVIACALPFIVSDYRTFQLTLVMVYAITGPGASTDMPGCPGSPGPPLLALGAAQCYTAGERLKLGGPKDREMHLL